MKSVYPSLEEFKNTKQVRGNKIKMTHPPSLPPSLSLSLLFSALVLTFALACIIRPEIHILIQMHFPSLCFHLVGGRKRMKSQTKEKTEKTTKRCRRLTRTDRAAPSKVSTVQYLLYSPYCTLPPATKTLPL